MTSPLQIVVVDDHPLIVEGVASIVRNAGHRLLATSGNPLEVLALLNRQRVDVVTLDIGMPGMNGLELARRIRTAYPSILLIFITQQVERTYVRSAFQAGANAFISKQSASTELKSAISALMQGQSYVTPGLLDELSRPDLTLKTSAALTARQRDVLQQLAEGKSQKEIAAALDISVKTVEFHKHALAQAIGVKTTAELTKYAIAEGLVFLPR